MPSLELKDEDLQQFVGGQIEIQSEGEQYIHRGEISGIRVENKELVVELVWMAKGVDWPLPTKWVATENTPYQISLIVCSVSNIGPTGGDVGGGDRICLQSFFVGETIILYPADGSKLDLAKVEGL